MKLDFRSIAMDQLKHFVMIPFLLLLLCLPPPATSDLNSDKQALLAFYAAVPHGRKINWNSSTPICSSWVGVHCSSDRTSVLSLRLPGSGLLGSIPAGTLGKLNALQVLSLRSNRIDKTLPPDIASLPSLKSLYLQNNNLSGNMPDSLSPSIVFLDLSFNSFTGAIPQTIQNLTQLTALFLQNNSLSGAIPDFNYSSLKYLNLSYNNLSGSLPFSLRKFSNASFLGNPFLCGPPLAPCSQLPTAPSPLPFPPAPALSPEKGKGFWKRLSVADIIAIATGGFVLLLLVAIIFFLCYLWRRDREGSGESKEKSATGGRGGKCREYSSGAQDAEKNKLVFFEGCSFNFDLEDLLRASAEVLGKGSYGTTYKAVLEDGTTVVVKRLREVVVGKKEFEQQMEIIGRVGQHQNVQPLRAYYYSKDEKLLVFDYVPSGSFASLLHGNRATGRIPLDWDTRLKISLGAAYGLAHIHSEGGVKFAHGDIRSTNILVTQDHDASVTDFGLATLMTSPATTSRIVIGYRAPEVIQTRKITHKSDIYSFGVLLLEMLTGKAPIHSPGRDDVLDLPRWVQSVVREEWTSEVFDEELARYTNIEEEMVQMLQIAMACVVKAPDRRPKIDEVVRMIEDIRRDDSENRDSPEKSGDSDVPTP